MIYPAPDGVDPTRYVCGECGGRLTKPWIETVRGDDGYNVQTYALKCVTDGAHETYVEKNNGRSKMLTGPGGQKVEVDVLTQQPTTDTTLVVVDSEASALVAVNKANALSMWPKDATPAEAVLLAHAAYHYQMDIFMGEIMPYQGKPFITIKGRRRHDKREGYRMGITFRMPRPDELEYWTSVEAMAKGDVIQIAVGTEPDGTVTEAMGRVLMSEQPTSAAGQTNLPIAIRKIEMAQKRAESRVREMVFGAIGKPQGLNPDVAVLGEGEGVGVVEGTFREIPANEPEAQTFPDFGECPEHGVEWKVEADKYTGNPRATHHITGKEWCNLSALYRTLFQTAWAAKFGEPDPKDMNAWLKENFGNTWSKLAHLECVQAVDKMRVDEATGEVESPVEEDASDDASEQGEPTTDAVPMPDSEEPLETVIDPTTGAEVEVPF